ATAAGGYGAGGYGAGGYGAGGYGAGGYGSQHGRGYGSSGKAQQQQGQQSQEGRPPLKYMLYLVQIGVLLRVKNCFVVGSFIADLYARSIRTLVMVC
ncbi:hypothetical protein BOX15_Mlig001777g2, partial [Macrostomum lignano]